MILNLPKITKVLAIKIILYNHSFWFLALILPVKKLLGPIGDPKHEFSCQYSNSQLSFVHFIKNIYLKTDEKWPYKFRCLIKVLTTSKILRQKKIPHQVFLGVRKDKLKLKAHAWLMCGKFSIVGGHLNEFTVVSSFTYDPSRQKRHRK